MITSQVNPTSRKKNEKSTDFSSIDKSTKEDKDISSSKNKASTHLKKKQIKEVIPTESISSTSKQPKKKVTWSNIPIVTVNVASFKKENLRNTHEEPGFTKNKVNCGCFIY